MIDKTPSKTIVASNSTNVNPFFTTHTTLSLNLN
jgi:hypothetical protein